MNFNIHVTRKVTNLFYKRHKAATLGVVLVYDTSLLYYTIVLIYSVYFKTLLNFNLFITTFKHCCRFFPCYLISLYCGNHIFDSVMVSQRYQILAQRKESKQRHRQTELSRTFSIGYVIANCGSLALNTNILCIESDQHTSYPLSPLPSKSEPKWFRIEF